MLASSLEPDVVLHVPGVHPLSGDHRGLASVGGFLQRTREATTDGEHMELIEVLFRLGDDDRIAEIWFHNRDQAPVDEFWS